MEEAVQFHKKLSPEFYEELEEILITSDVGIKTTMLLMEKLKAKVKAERADDTAAVQGLSPYDYHRTPFGAPPPVLEDDVPLALLVVGVNGVGKTTSIAKLTAQYYTEQGRSCLLVAGILSGRPPLISWRSGRKGPGPILLATKTVPTRGRLPLMVLSAANARKIDVAIFDTAGRLHTKVNLMSELKKSTGSSPRI